MMKLLKPQRSHTVDMLEKPSLDNRPNAWYKANHIIAVMCVPDAQHKDDVKMPTTKCTGAKQSTLFTFLGDDLYQSSTQCWHTIWTVVFIVDFVIDHYSEYSLLEEPWELNTRIT